MVTMKRFFSKLVSTALAAGIVFSVSPSPSYSIVEPDLTNILGNPSFEFSLGSGTGNWDNTPNRGISNPPVGVAAANGARALQLSEAALSAGTAGAFTFQTFALGGAQKDIFVSFSALVRMIVLDVDGTDAQLQIEFNDANGRQISATNTGNLGFAAGAGWARATVNAVAPEGTTEVVFTIRLNTAVAPNAAGTVAQFDDAVGTITTFPIAIDASASKPFVSKGNASYISARIKNVSTVTFGSLELAASLPEGFSFIDTASRLDGREIDSRIGSRIFSIGGLSNGESKSLGFLLVVSSAVQIGKKYEVSFFAQQTNGTVRSATKRIVIEIIADPLFDEGIILGKVFDDQNENTVQDKGEFGVPGVKLATEEGIIVITDPNGRYHIPAVKPGRHVVKIDGHTLPQGTKFVSDEARVTKTTEGILNVVDFAVKLPEPQIPKKYRDQLSVLITQGADLTKPELSVGLEPEILRMGVGYLEKNPVFKIRTNYPDLVFSWRIEIRDQFGEEVWTGFGLGAPPVEAPWKGLRKDRSPIEKGIYSYRLILRDAEGREDWTPLKYFRVVSKLDPHAPDQPNIEVPAVGNMSIERDGKRSIPVVASPKILVRGKTVPWNSVSVNGEKVGVNLDGTFQSEFYAQPGNQSVQVKATDPEGNAVSYEEEVKVKDSYFFMVGLGEEELGANITQGNVEVVGREDLFHHGFYNDGRLAFYLKGKVKGKFLVTGRYDTDDPRKEFFTNLDPDQYYPVYGDDSEINFDATNSQHRAYILVEMDRSYVKWGSFHSNLTDTELSTHNRTFSGFKLYYETLSATRYGDAQRGFVVYSADANHLADHNEFLGTGGSLFYLRNKNAVEGSEKARVEIRDSIQGMPVYSRDLAYGTDYEIDYGQGRIILRKPLSAVSNSDTIISNDILSGSQTFLIVDYEFEPQGDVSDRNNGLRGFMHLGDHIRVGGTAIEDKQPGLDYDLRGLDLTAKFGRNTKVTAEYARTQNRASRNAVSFDGGITFTDIETGNTLAKKVTRIFDDAYLLKGETKLKRIGTEFSGYAQEVNPGFANATSIRQAGMRKAGLEIRQPIGDYVQASYRYDVLKTLDPENRSGVFFESPEEGRFHSAQLKADYEKYLMVAEYRNQDVDTHPENVRSFTNIFDEVRFQNAFAGKLGYRVTEDFMPYAKAQATTGDGGGQNHQFGGGVEATVMGGKGVVRLEELAGTAGDSTELSFRVKAKDNADVYTTLRTAPDTGLGGRAFSTTIGSSSQVNSKSRFYSEREFSSFREGERSTGILGYDTELSERWGADFRFERAQLYPISEINTHRNSGALEISYRDRDILKAVSRYELRFDGGSEERLHWFFRDTLDWKVSESTRFSARFNRSDTNQVLEDRFKADASTTELNLGLAYRPVEHNRLNVLTRYTWLSEVGAENQFNTPDIFGISVDEMSHIAGLEIAYDALPSFAGLVEKFAYRRSRLDIGENDNFYLSSFLWVNRINIHVIRKWDLALEYRLLWDFELLDGLKHGALAEIDREILNYGRIGIGYNFTDFDDDLRSANSISRHGFFTRLSGKF